MQQANLKQQRQHRAGRRARGGQLTFVLPLLMVAAVVARVLMRAEGMW